MGLVNFDTDIQKTVDILKTVNLDVFKTVDATVGIDGKLATAEAAADVVAFDVLRFDTFRLLIDDFSMDLMRTTTPTNSPQVFDQISFSRTDLPMGADNRGGELTFLGTNVDPPPPPDDLVLVFESNFGSPQNNQLLYRADANTLGELEIVYAGTAGSPNQIPIDLTADGGDVLLFKGVSSTFSRVTIEVELREVQEVGGEVGEVTLRIPPILVTSPIDIPVPFNRFSNSESIDFAQIDTITLLIENEPQSVRSSLLIDDFGTARGPVIAASALAETDTFAQVSDAGAFSFSESLAAASTVETDMLLG